MMEEGEDVFGGHGAGGFEFTVFLREEELAIGIKNRDGGDTAVQGDIVFFSNVEIAIHFADVDVDDEERFGERGSNFGRLEGFIEDMAIETPVTSEDEKDTFVGSGGGAEGVGDFFCGIGGGGVDVFALDGLAKPSGSGVGAEDNLPAIVMLTPSLGKDDVLTLRGDAGLEDESELLDENVDALLGVLLIGDFGGEVDETLGFEGGPESDFVGERDVFAVSATEFRFGGGRVDGGESVGVTGQDGGAPLTEGGERGADKLSDGGERGGQESEEEAESAHGRLDGQSSTRGA
jgi:hypothetical protein